MPAPKIPPKFEIFQTADGQWSYRIRHGNGKIASASETYTRKATAKRMATNLRDALRLVWAEVVELPPDAEAAESRRRRDEQRLHDDVMIAAR